MSIKAYMHIWGKNVSIDLSSSDILKRNFLHEHTACAHSLETTLWKTYKKILTVAVDSHIWQVFKVKDKKTESSQLLITVTENRGKLMFIEGDSWTSATWHHAVERGTYEGFIKNSLPNEWARVPLSLAHCLEAWLFPWRQLLGDSEIMITRGVCMVGSAGVYRVATQREIGVRKRVWWGGYSSLIWADIHLNYLLYQNKEMLSEVQSSEQKQIWLHSAYACWPY